MHEMSIAMNIVDLAVTEAEANNSNKINLIELEIGTLAGVMIDSLEFCFAVVIKDSLAHGAELKINRVPGQARCAACNMIFPIDFLVAQCPECNKYQMTILKGKELRIISIVVDE